MELKTLYLSLQIKSASHGVLQITQTFAVMGTIRQLASL